MSEWGHCKSVFWKSPITQLVFTLANTSEQHNFTQHASDMIALSHNKLMLPLYNFTKYAIALPNNIQPCYHFPAALSQLQLGGNSKQAVDWTFANGHIRRPFVTTCIFQVFINLTVVPGKQKSIISYTCIWQIIIPP